MVIKRYENGLLRHGAMYPVYIVICCKGKYESLTALSRQFYPLLVMAKQLILCPECFLVKCCGRVES